jgi:hypothetical protein
MMELEGARRRAGEDFTDLFERIVREADVDRYLIYVPQNGVLLGLTWEFRGLRDQLKAGQLGPEQVHLFTQEGVAGLNAERGGFEFVEPANRTFYFEDLLHWGCTPRPWSDYESLRDKVLQAAAEDLSIS